MKEKFTSSLSMNPANKARLTTINEILEDYKTQGYVLTLRQLYYQLVSKDIIPNKVEEYAKLSILLKKGRMAGVIDWSSIEDRGRVPKLPYHVEDIADAIDDAYKTYRIDLQRNQPIYMEVWVEKDALSNIFYRVTSKYHIRLMVNKGYSSCSAMKAAADRFKWYGNEHGKKSALLYFGDHDPSGKDMVRDIRERLEEFLVEDIQVINPALDMSHIKKYNPPKNPAKFTDPRAKWYIEKYGTNSWELDALKPSVLENIIEQSILEHLDLEQYNRMVEIQQRDKAILKSIAAKYKN